MKKTVSARKWPCVFAGDFIEKQVNPRLYEQDKTTPFGAFQRAWRTFHCAEINPYGSESCPYAEEDCAIAYLMAAQQALGARKSRIGLFQILAQKRGWQRAENKPLARSRIVRTDGHQNGASDLRDGPGAGPGDDLGHGGTPGTPGPLAQLRTVDLRSSSHRPQSIGELLRGDGAGPRTQPYRRHEEQEAADDHGDTGDPVSPPSSRRLGDQPPSGNPGLHQGGE